MTNIQMHTPKHLNEWMEQAILSIYELIVRGTPICLTASGGKDSSVTTILGLEAIRRVKNDGISQPTHYVTSADTTVENPAMAQHLERFLEDIREYCDEHDLDVKVKIAKPALASQFVVSTIGRGSLVRTLQNSVKDGKGQRSCSVEYKIRPLNKLKKELSDDATQGTFREPVTILGTRKSESSARASLMTKRGETADEIFRNSNGDLTFSIISSWSTDDVWWMLSLFTNSASFPFPSPVSARSINRMHELYREANEGTCGVVLGEAGHRQSCGSRFGCFSCLISGEKDKSMESMIREPKHAHLAGLNQYRNYLLNTQWDLSKRELVGRTVSPAGYIRIQADTYSFEHRMDLLRMLLTLDAREVERAEKHTDDLHLGRIEDNEANQELCDIQFEMISPQQLVAIDFQLGMHHYCDRAFPAISAWYEVHRLGRRAEIPVIAEPVGKSAIKLHGWFPVGKFDAEVPVDGLRDYQAELWNRHRHPGRAGSFGQTPDGERVCYFEEDDCLSVDPSEATAFVTCVFDMGFYHATQSAVGLESTRFWLNEAILKLPKGKANIYQKMAQRGQYFNNLAAKKNLAPQELDSYLKENCIENGEHDTVLKQLQGDQHQLFGDDDQAGQISMFM